MFAIRFIQHDGDYKSYSVVSYDVTRKGDVAIVGMRQKLGGRDYDTEYVSDDDLYRVAYVTNDAGKTIDVIGKKDAKT